MSGDCSECGLTPDDGCPGPLDRCRSVRAKDGDEWCEINDVHPDSTEGNYARQAFHDGRYSKIAAALDVPPPQKEEKISEDETWVAVHRAEAEEIDLLRKATRLLLEGRSGDSRMVLERACSFAWMARRLRDYLHGDYERVSRKLFVQDPQKKETEKVLMELLAMIEEAKKTAFCGAAHPEMPSVNKCDRKYGHTGDHRGREEHPDDIYGSDNIYWSKP